MGLGNPGPDYELTRHNVGFRVADAFVDSHAGSWRKSKHRALVADVEIASLHVTVGKPQTYMNVSGESVKALARSVPVEPVGILVVHDELDLPLGELRLKFAGGTAGHNGLKSIEKVLGTPAFARLRFGIGRPPGRMDPADFVLRRFRGEESDIVETEIPRAVEMVESWLLHGVEATQNAFH